MTDKYNNITDKCNYTMDKYNNMIDKYTDITILLKETNSTTSM